MPSYHGRRISSVGLLPIIHKDALGPVLTDQAHGHRQGLEIHITREMLTRYLLGLNGPVYYIAGPSGMVTGMTDLLVSSGVSPDDMRTEEFGDYKLYQDSTPADQTIDNSRSNSAP